MATCLEEHDARGDWRAWDMETVAGAGWGGWDSEESVEMGPETQRGDRRFCPEVDSAEN